MIQRHEKNIVFDIFYANIKLILLYFSKNRKGVPQKLNQIEVEPNEIKAFQINNNDIKFIYFKINKK